MKYQIYHTERNHTQGLQWGHVGFNDTRSAGPLDGFETCADAEDYLRDMQAQARANGANEYADALHVAPMEAA